jgi:hypothetical protein
VPQACPSPIPLRESLIFYNVFKYPQKIHSVAVAQRHVVEPGPPGPAYLKHGPKGRVSNRHGPKGPNSEKWTVPQACPSPIPLKPISPQKRPENPNKTTFAYSKFNRENDQKTSQFFGLLAQHAGRGVGFLSQKGAA